MNSVLFPSINRCFQAEAADERRLFESRRTSFQRQVRVVHPGTTASGSLRFGKTGPAQSQHSWVFPRPTKLKMIRRRITVTTRASGGGDINDIMAKVS